MINGVILMLNFGVIVMSKKKFECGHVGRGTYCHHCNQELAERQTEIDSQINRQNRKNNWLRSFEEDPISLKCIQDKKYVVKKARSIIEKITNGVPIHQLRGKHLKQCQNIISIPVGRAYRLICRTTSAGYVVECLLSHEQYNSYIRQN